MGNQMCCKDYEGKAQLPSQSLPSVRRTNPHVQKINTSNHGQKTHTSNIQESVDSKIHKSSSVISSNTNITIPKVTSQIENHLEKFKPLENKLPKNPTIKQFGDEVYAGEINFRGRPDGYGKMYRNNGSLFIGRFDGGVANGIGHYIKPDGSYYEGNMKDNKANDSEGFFWSPLLEYRGGIIDNKFNGKGKQKGENHEFQGEYKDGHKVFGTMSWRDRQAKYIYTGPFNQHGTFHGKGKLEQSNLGTYEGQFQDGQKHGHGQFDFLGGKKYIGQYYYGVKQGHGKTLNKMGQVTYEGQWNNGLPHGVGRARTKEGTYVERKFVQGLDKEFLEDDY